MDTSMTYFPLINKTLIIISVRCIPLSLRSKTRRRATFLLPTWICSHRSGGTVSFALPFTTNMTIFNFHITNFPFLRNNFLLWGWSNFQISFSGRYMSGNTWIWKGTLLRCIHHFKSDWMNNMDHMRILGIETSSVILSQTVYWEVRLLGNCLFRSYIVYTRILSNNVKSPSPECYIVHPALVGHYNNSWPCYRLRPFYQFPRGFQRAFATGMACQQRKSTPLDIWSCSI